MDEKLNPIYDVVNPGRNVPAHQALVKRIQEVQAQNLARQQQDAGATQAKLTELEGMAPQKDYSAFMAATDALTGSNMSGIYQNIRKQDQTPNQIQQLRTLLGKQQGDVGDSELKALKMEADILGNQDKYAMMKEMYKGKQSAADEKPSSGQKKVDDIFAKDYSDWSASGGYASAIANLDLLKESVGKLGGNPGEKGYREYGSTMLPDFVRKRTDPDAMKLQQDVEFVAQQSLKQILGGAFAKDEATQLIQRTYDPALSNVQNKQKLDALIKRLEVGAKAKQRAMQYYENNNSSLKGYQGDNNLTLGTFNTQLKKDILGAGEDKKTPAVELGGKAKELAKELGL